MKRVYVDFNSAMRDPEDRVLIAHVGRPKKRAIPDLTPGETILIYDEEMEVQAIVAFDQQHQAWLAVPDWETVVDYPTPSVRSAQLGG